MSIKDKKGFQLYHDMGVVVDALTDQQAGQLLKAILAHVRMEYYEIEDPVVQIAFLPIRQTLERDHEKYLGIVDRNRANGSKGGRPRKNPVGYLGTQENPKEPKKADRDIGKDIDTDKEKKGTNVPKEKASRIRSLEWDQEFDIFWNLCPKKKSKEQARKAWHKMRRNKSCTMPPEEVAQLYRKHYDSQRDSQYAQHPGTWLNAMGYEDEEPEQQQQPAATDPKGRPLPPGYSWDNDLYGIRNQFGYQVGEDMVEQEWRKLGNEEKAQKWVHMEPNWEMV